MINIFSKEVKNKIFLGTQLQKNVKILQKKSTKTLILF